jgi:hypothetical protein
MLVEKLETAQAALLRDADAADKRFATMASDGDDDACIASAVTLFVEKTADEAFHAWRDFFLTLFAATRDGFLFGAPVSRQCPPPPQPKTPGCTSRVVPLAKEVGYDVKWRARVAADGENAEHYAVPNEQSNDAEVYAVWKRARMEKTRLITNGVVKNVRGASDDVYEIRAERAVASR